MSWFKPPSVRRGQPTMKDKQNQMRQRQANQRNRPVGAGPQKPQRPPQAPQPQQDFQPSAAQQAKQGQPQNPVQQATVDQRALQQAMRGGPGQPPPGGQIGRLHQPGMTPGQPPPNQAGMPPSNQPAMGVAKPRPDIGTPAQTTDADLAAYGQARDAQAGRLPSQHAQRPDLATDNTGAEVGGTEPTNTGAEAGGTGGVGSAFGIDTDAIKRALGGAIGAGAAAGDAAPTQPPPTQPPAVDPTQPPPDVMDGFVQPGLPNPAAVPGMPSVATDLATGTVSNALSAPAPAGAAGKEQTGAVHEKTRPDLNDPADTYEGPVDDYGFPTEYSEGGAAPGELQTQLFDNVPSDVERAPATQSHTDEGLNPDWWAANPDYVPNRGDFSDGQIPDWAQNIINQKQGMDSEQPREVEQASEMPVTDTGDPVPGTVPNYGEPDPSGSGEAGGTPGADIPQRDPNTLPAGASWADGAPPPPRDEPPPASVPSSAGGTPPAGTIGGYRSERDIPDVEIPAETELRGADSYTEWDRRDAGQGAEERPDTPDKSQSFDDIMSSWDQYVQAQEAPQWVRDQYDAAQTHNQQALEQALGLAQREQSRFGRRATEMGMGSAYGGGQQAGLAQASLAGRDLGMKAQQRYGEKAAELAQQRAGDELGYARDTMRMGLDRAMAGQDAYQQGREFDWGAETDRWKMGEDARQFDVRTEEDSRQFGAKMGEEQRQFDYQAKEDAAMDRARFGADTDFRSYELGEEADRFEYGTDVEADERSYRRGRDEVGDDRWEREFDLRTQESEEQRDIDRARLALDGDGGGMGLGGLDPDASPEEQAEYLAPHHNGIVADIAMNPGSTSQHLSRMSDAEFEAFKKNAYSSRAYNDMTDEQRRLLEEAINEEWRYRDRKRSGR